VKIECKRQGCRAAVVQTGVGRPPDFCSVTCRAADRRERERTRLAVHAAEVLLVSPEPAVVRALAALPPRSLSMLLEALPRGSSAI
jgi:hypothetical protein